MVPRYSIVGAGYAFRKYILPEVLRGSIVADAVFSLESPETFYSLFENFSVVPAYFQFSGSPARDSITLLSSLSSHKFSSDLLLLLPSFPRVALLAALSMYPSSSMLRLFLDKPYAPDYESLRWLQSHIGNFNCVHFASRYSFSRASSFIFNALSLAWPESVELRLIEGTKYFDVVAKRISTAGSHPFFSVGPELDLGIHLLDILFRYVFLKSGAIPRVRTSSIKVLHPSSFEPGYGSGFSFVLNTDSGHEIPVHLIVGKRKGAHERFVRFFYSSGRSLMQLFSLDTYLDPLYLLAPNAVSLISLQRHGGNYYVSELMPEAFCTDYFTNFRLSLAVNKVALDLRNLNIKEEALT